MSVIKKKKNVEGTILKPGIKGGRKKKRLLTYVLLPKRLDIFSIHLYNIAVIFITYFM